MAVRSEAAKKAWKTRRRNEASRKRKHRAAGKKAWKTMKAREAEMTPRQLKAMKKKRSNAGKKAWETRRVNAA